MDRQDITMSFLQFDSNWLYMSGIACLTFICLLIGKIFGERLGKNSLHKKHSVLAFS